MVHIKELEVTIGVDEKNQFIGKKDGEKFIAITSISKEDIRKELLQICSELKETTLSNKNICQYKKCGNAFYSKRADAKYCSNKCRQAKRYEKLKGDAKK